jgi:hypothetical protein
MASTAPTSTTRHVALLSRSLSRPLYAGRREQRTIAFNNVHAAWRLAVRLALNVASICASMHLLGCAGLRQHSLGKFRDVPLEFLLLHFPQVLAMNEKTHFFAVEVAVHFG